MSSCINIILEFFWVFLNINFLTLAEIFHHLFHK